MAAVAVGLQNRLNVALEIDFGGSLSVEHSAEHGNIEHSIWTAIH
jgi:hypothetical protein